MFQSLQLTGCGAGACSSDKPSDKSVHLGPEVDCEEDADHEQGQIQQVIAFALVECTIQLAHALLECHP